MNCYYCEQDHGGATRYGVKAAIGVCQHCGVGICLAHSHKEDQPGTPLLCAECAALLQVKAWSAVAQRPIAGHATSVLPMGTPTVTLRR